MQPAAGISVVIVTYRSREIVGRALQALEPLHGSGVLECVVVDNGSDDATAASVRSGFPWVSVVENRANLGFARAANIGIERSRGATVLFLNPDAVVEAESVHLLQSFLEAHPAVGIAGPLLSDRGGIWEVERAFPTPWGTVAKTYGGLAPSRRTRAIDPDTGPIRATWCRGAAILVRRTLLERIGGFDPRFFLYFEEVDLARRAADAGWEVWVVRGARADHYGAHSARSTGAELYRDCIAEHYFQSRFYYLAKHHGWAAAVAAELGEYAVSMLRSLSHRLRGREEDAELRVRLAAPLLRLPGEV